jgi:hypothetical protein
MRIIVTKNGKIILQELEDEKNIGNFEDNANHNKKYRNFSGLKLPRLNKKFSTLKSFYENTKKVQWGANHRTKSVISKRTMDNYFNRDESKINKQELKQAKKIKLSKSKISISQQFLNKYDDLDVTYKDKIKNLTNTLKSNIDKNNEEKLQNELNEQNKIFNTLNTIKTKEIILNTNNKLLNKNEDFNEKKQQILLGDIISRNNLLSLKSQISKDNLGHDDTRLPLDEKNKNSFNLRSKYEDKKATLDSLAIILSLPMNPDRTNLIKYYKQKKDISPFYFENLLKYDEGQIYKLNKICQIIFHKKEDEMKELKIIEDKKFNKEKLLRQKANNYMNCANKIINKSNGIINGYTLKQEIYSNKKKKIYKDEVKKIKKNYWDRYGINKFYKENQIKDQNFLSTTDFEEMQYNGQKIKKNILNSKSSPNIFS